MAKKGKAKDKGKGKAGSKPARLELEKMKTICFMNQKGGVGKSTTAVTTAVVLAGWGYRVLVVDVDAQGNSTSLLNVETQGKPTVFEVIKAECDAREAIQPSYTLPAYKTDKAGELVMDGGRPVVKRKARPRGVDVVPADSSLRSLVSIAGELRGLDARLVKPLASVSGEYDFCLIDCPPDLNYATVMALTASDYVVVPTMAALFSVQGFTELFGTVKDVVSFSNEDLRILGVLFTWVRDKTKIFRRTRLDTEELAEAAGTFVYDASIRHTVKFDDACDEGLTIVEYAPECGAAQDYRDFAAEMLEAIRGDVAQATTTF